MSPRVVMRYVPFTIQQDPIAHPTYAAVCVIGEEADCGATSGEHHDPAPVEEWMRKHVQDSRHTRYRRTFTDYAVWEPDDGPDTASTGTGTGDGDGDEGEQL